MLSPDSFGLWTEKPLTKKESKTTVVQFRQCIKKYWNAWRLIHDALSGVFSVLNMIKSLSSWMQWKKTCSNVKKENIVSCMRYVCLHLINVSISFYKRMT